MANQFLNNIPIIVDAPSRPFFPMVRCYYIAIEFDVPDNQWTIGLAGEQLPVLMLGLTGIVQAPPGAPRFNRPELIDRLFGLVEGSRGLVNFEDVWLPASLFWEGTKTGSVYRIEIDLFRTAFAFVIRACPEKPWKRAVESYMSRFDFPPMKPRRFNFGLLRLLPSPRDGNRRILISAYGQRGSCDDAHTGA